jgi:indolepyruvate ferredoxin oxidoreductase, beta subunit
VELAECQTLVKGYGDTHERGWANFSQICALAPKLLGDRQAAERVRALREAALADDSGMQLERSISQIPVSAADMFTADRAVSRSPNG